MSNEEIIYVVDENDKFVRKATRREVEENHLWHRIARVVIVDKDGKLLIQKRAHNKSFYPGWWDIGVTETVKNGESYETAAMRGLLEELGIIGISNIQLIHSLLSKVKYQSQNSNVHCKIYWHKHNGTLIPDKGEIEEVRFLAIDELKQLMQKERFTPGGIVAFNTYLQKRN